jgi:hypothetical protein
LLQVEPEREPVAGVAADIVHHSGLVQPTLHLTTEQINMVILRSRLVKITSF